MGIEADNSIISTMTEKERQDPSLIKNREDYQNSMISVYYGSAKKELVNTCLDCKKKGTCKEYKDIREKEYMLQVGLHNPQMVKEMNLTEQDRQKLLNNVFMIVNCKIKEKMK